ncbi:MAG: VRR-NUC domain-containing protein [Bacteroidales bacterium]|nr:VRR-NUC domain-containing protein [Bacteroidales bacterium]
MRHAESNLQMACVRWFRIQYRHIGRMLISVPNGGARDRITGAILKAEGVVAGAPDLVLFVANKHHHGLMIEMKTKTGKQSDSQKEFQIRAEAQGYRYEIVRDFDSFTKVIHEHLKGTLYDVPAL